jgi:hypothetical protein
MENMNEKYHTGQESRFGKANRDQVLPSSGERQMRVKQRWTVCQVRKTNGARNTD